MVDKSKLSLIIELSDFVLLRISPQFLHTEIYNNGSGLISKLTNKLYKANKILPGEHFRAIGSKMLFQKIIEEEDLRSNKGIFLHAHIYIPHGPYVLDEKADYDPSPYDSASAEKRYMSQVKGALYLINQFLEKLKSQNKFKKFSYNI